MAISTHVHLPRSDLSRQIANFIGVFLILRGYSPDDTTFNEVLHQLQYSVAVEFVGCHCSPNLVNYLKWIGLVAQFLGVFDLFHYEVYCFFLVSSHHFLQSHRLLVILTQDTTQILTFFHDCVTVLHEGRMWVE